MAEVMAAVDESEDFCLFGKLRRRQKQLFMVATAERK